MPDETWSVWVDGAWVPYSSADFSYGGPYYVPRSYGYSGGYYDDGYGYSRPYRYRSGYRGWDDGYDFGGGYFDYDRGYYGRGYYGRGYGGYGYGGYGEGGSIYVSPGGVSFGFGW
jgi:hypothetical protein